MEPRAFCAALETKTFTNNADMSMVQEKYTSTFHETFSEVLQLHFGGLGWGDEEAEALAEVLPFCKVAKGLALFGNQIGDVGVQALASAVADGAMANLKIIYIGDDSFGDAAKEQLKEACKARNIKVG